MQSQHRFQHSVLTFIAYHSDLLSEKERLIKVFNEMDKNKDQLISLEELQSAISKSGIIMSEKEVTELFKKMDADQCGSISYTEFLAGAMEISSLISDRALEAAFKFYDKDGSGFIEKCEVTNALKQGWITEKQVSELFAETDLDHDSKVMTSKRRDYCAIIIDLDERVQNYDDENGREAEDGLELRKKVCR